MSSIFLDNASTTRPFDDILDEVRKVSEKTYGNPSSNHSEGRASRRVLDESRERIAAALNLDPKHIIFTSSATEANNMVVSSIIRNKKVENIVTSAIEHESILKPLRHYKPENICNIPVNESGVYDIDFIRENVTDTTCLMLSMVNNELGSIAPLNALKEIKERKSPFLFVDCAQAVGKTDIPVFADFMTFSSHKIHGPRGAACVIVSDRELLKSFLLGGEQEFNRRAGTEDVASIHGFSLAFERAIKDRSENYRKLKALRQLFIEGLGNIGIQFRLLTDLERSSPHILNVSFPGHSSEMMLLKMDRVGICAAGGSACSSQSIIMSHVIESLPIDDEFKKSSVRFSFSVMNTEEEIKEAVQRLRSIF